VNIELYIQSGIVESYVLGLASPPEMAELEQLLPHYPELKEALTEFEYQLELFSIDNEEPPPPGTREKVAARLRELPTVRTAPPGKGTGRGHSPGYIAVEVTSPYIKVHKGWRTFLIAVFILSKILLVASIYYFISYRNAQKQLQKLEQQQGTKN
jgi:hypothetical protein